MKWIMISEDFFRWVTVVFKSSPVQNVIIPLVVCAFVYIIYKYFKKRRIKKQE